MNKMFALIMFVITVSVNGNFWAQEKLLMDIGDWEPFTSSRDTESQILEQLVREIYALFGIKVEYRYYPWLRSLTNVENGECDGSFPLIKTPERDITTLSCKEPILIEDSVFFYLKKKRFDWSTMDDLKPYRIGGTIDYAYMEPFENVNLHIEYVAYEDLNFITLAERRIDIYPASREVGIYLIHMLFEEPEISQFTYHPKPLNSQKYYVLISRKNPRAQELADLFDEGL